MKRMGYEYKNIIRYFTLDKLNFLRKHTSLDGRDEKNLRKKTKKYEKKNPSDPSFALSYEYYLRYLTWRKKIKKDLKYLKAYTSKEDVDAKAEEEMYYIMRHENNYNKENKVCLDLSQVFPLDSQVDENVVRAVIGPLTEEEYANYIKNSGIDYNYENGFCYYNETGAKTVITIKDIRGNTKNVIGIEKNEDGKDPLVKESIYNPKKGEVLYITDDNTAYVLSEEMKKTVDKARENMKNQVERKSAIGINMKAKENGKPEITPQQEIIPEEITRRPRSTRYFEVNPETSTPIITTPEEKKYLDFSKVYDIEWGINQIRIGIFPAVIKRDTSNLTDYQKEILQKHYDFLEDESCYIYRAKREDCISMIIDRNNSILKIERHMFAGEMLKDKQIILDGDVAYTTSDGAVHQLSILQEQIIEELKEKKHI